MGLFDIFSRKSPLEKHAERVANKRAQNPDRWESIQFLGKLATTEPSGGAEDEREAAVAALMERFTFYVDPSITDGEEKEEVFRWLCGAGEVAVAPIREALRSQESVSWGFKVLEQIVDEDCLVQEMIDLLGTMNTDYERDPSRKVQLLSILESKSHPDIAAAVVPFFEDVNEESRFHALGAALAQANVEDVLDALRDALAEEDSLRVLVRVFDRMADRELSLGDAADQIDFPDGWGVDGDGVPKKGAAPPGAKKAPKRKKRR